MALELVIAIIAGLLGTTGSGYLGYVISQRQEKRKDLTYIVERIDADNTRLRANSEKKDAQIAMLNEKMDLLQLEIGKLYTKIQLLESAHMDLPLPMWLKSTDGVMLALNTSYEDVFLKPRGYSVFNYIGNKDDAVWPKEVCEDLKKNDDFVVKSKAIWTGIEKIENDDGGITLWNIIKYPRMSGRTVIGIGGIALKKSSTNKDTS